MLRDAGEKWAGRYVDLLSNITTQILGHSFAVRIVIHSTAMGRDRAIGVEIVRRARSEKVSVLESEDPLELKGVIGKSWMLVGSRYHSLVAAFSNAVPSICMGWAHKYDMLYRDFGFEDLVLGADSPDQEVQHKVASLMDRHTNNEHREKLRARLDELRPVNQEMWHRVCKVLVGSQERRMSGGA